MQYNFLNDIKKENYAKKVYSDYKKFMKTKDISYADSIISFFVPYVREKVRDYYIGSIDDYDEIVQLILIDIYNELLTTTYAFGTFKDYIIKGVYSKILTHNEEVMTEKRSYSRKIIQFMNIYKSLYGSFDYNTFIPRKVEVALEEMKEKYNYSEKVMDNFLDILCNWYYVDAFKGLNNIPYIEEAKSPEQLYIEKDLPQIEEMIKGDGIEYIKYKSGYYGEPVKNNKLVAQICGVSQDKVRKQIKETKKLFKVHYDIIKRHY